MKKDNQKNSIIIYEGDDGQSHVEVRFEGETAWLSQAQLVDLYQSSKANVSEHIKNIFFDRELEENVVVRKIRTTTKHDATKFRIWATARLKEYIVKGFTIDSDRLKNLIWKLLKLWGKRLKRKQKKNLLNLKNNMNESETRAKYIDPKLKQAGWGEAEESELKVKTICYN